jgi:hypothetical protein|tara:strand:+ start:4468 stop:4866 length:399 start_codon:yes stop_codon:yes gene_type:complete
MTKQQQKHGNLDIVKKYFPLSALNGSLVRAVERSSEIMAKSAQTLPKEMGEFIGRRVHKDASFYGQCANCEDFGKFIEIQQNWWKQASEDYAKQANQIISLSQSLATEVSDAVIQSAEEEMAALEKEVQGQE